MYRKDFPMASKYTFLDSASICLKPKIMVKAIVDFYTNKVANPHSSDNPLGIMAHDIITDTRKRIAKLINCKDDEIIFTSGSTESSNNFIKAYLEKLNSNDEIIVFDDLHASTFVPVLEVNKKVNIKIYTITQDEQILKYISSKTKLVIVAEMNNTTGETHNLKLLYEVIKKNSPDCVLLNDAAQAIAHKVINFKYSDALYFSTSKFYGPTGLGCLVIKKKLRDSLLPIKFGGGANKNFSESKWIPTSTVELWEAGTPNTGAIFAFNATLKYLEEIDREKVFKEEIDLANYLKEKLLEIGNVKVLSKENSPIVLFAMKDYSAQDVVSYLGHNKVITRAGFHCANLTSKISSYNGNTIRVSLAMYNNKSDIDKLLKLIKRGDFLDGIL